MKEVWKDIEGYEGLYQVSNLGRIKSLKRNVKYRESVRTVKEKIKYGFIDAKGYMRIELSKDGINRKYSIHRLVAKAFISNLENKTEINHINGNKTDNRVENLEWCTRSENEKHAYKLGLAQNSKKQRDVAAKYCRENKTKSIIQLDLKGNFIKEWKSAVEIEQVLKINRKNISQCVTGRNKTASGFKWVTKEQFKSVEYII